MRAGAAALPPTLREPDKAAPLYRQAIHIPERLAAQDPKDMQSRFDLASKYGKLGDALWQLRELYLTAIGRPMILLGRQKERTPLRDLRTGWKCWSLKCYLHAISRPKADGKEAMRLLDEDIAEGEALHAGHPNDLTATYMLSNSYREMARIATGERCRQALLHSATAWHAWPATSYTKREEEQDRNAAL